MSDKTYTTERLPPFRQLVIDGMEVGSRKHRIHGLVEVDVSTAREHLRQLKEETGESFSFTGFLIYCCAQAVDENKHLHAYRDWRNRLVLFDDVDISLPVERQAEGKAEVLQIVIRAANRKSIREIHREIRQAQSKDFVETPLGRYLRLYTAVPAFIRHALFRAINRRPHLVKKMGGTVMVTSVGMFGSGAAWGIPLSGHTLCVTVGGIVSRPAVIEGQVVDKEHVCLTATFDHDIIDGAPAARFIQRLRELVESGSGLFDET